MSLCTLYTQDTRDVYLSSNGHAYVCPMVVSNSIYSRYELMSKYFCDTTNRAADELQRNKSEFHIGLTWRGINLDAKHSMAKTKDKRAKGKKVVKLRPMWIEHRTFRYSD